MPFEFLKLSLFKHNKNQDGRHFLFALLTGYCGFNSFPAISPASVAVFFQLLSLAPVTLFSRHFHGLAVFTSAFRYARPTGQTSGTNQD